MSAAPGRAAGPWDALLHGPRVSLRPINLEVVEDAKPASRLAGLLAELASAGSATTLSLAMRAELETRQVWGLLKAPRARGQVRFEDGRWSLVETWQGREVERAAALLRARGWRVEAPPNARGKPPEGSA